LTELFASATKLTKLPQSFAKLTSLTIFAVKPIPEELQALLSEVKRCDVAKLVVQHFSKKRMHETDDLNFNKFPKREGFQLNSRFIS
jgi:hypothetical protein